MSGEGEGQVLEGQIPGEGLGNDEGEGKGSGEEDHVVISKELYESMLAQITAGTQASQKVLSKVEQEEAEIARAEAEAQRLANAGRYEKAKNPTELAQMIREDVMSDVQELVYPVASTVMSIVVAEEIKETARKHTDFDSYKDDVRKLTENNTKLSIEDAYLIASGKKAKPAEEEKKGDVGKGKENKPVVGGEKPGAGSNNMNKGSAQTIKDAVRMASEKVLGNRE